MASAASHDIDDYESLLVALQNVLGVVVPDAQRSHLVQRIEPLLSTYRLDSIASLAECLQSVQPDDSKSSDIKSSVLDAISEYRSNWSLSPVTLNLLHEYVFSQLNNNARVWIVGCGQGQAAYGIAMELADYEYKLGESKNLKLVATDSTLSNIKKAESATYDMQQLAGIRADYNKLYTTAANNGSERVIKDKIRKRVQFSQCDLTEDFQSVGTMDLIICPEILVYYSNGVKAGILKQFSKLLNSGGILLTGLHQFIPADLGLERVDHPAGVFYRQKG